MTVSTINVHPNYAGVVGGGYDLAVLTLSATAPAGVAGHQP